MTVYRFEKRVTKNFGKILEPSIPISIVGPDQRVDVMALIDSGADISLFPYSIAELIGAPLDLKELREIHGLGQSGVPYILGTATMVIAESEMTARVAWALIDEAPLVLGRLDVFESFVIEFREYEDRIVIEPRPE